MTFAFQRLADAAARQLSPARFLHVLGVAHTAVALAMRHGADAQSAAAAALLHDISKSMTAEEIEADLVQRGGAIAEEDRAHPAIWHGLHAARLAGDYEIPPEKRDEIARAVAAHSTADSGMSPLAQILCLADYLEPGRSFEGIDALRELARSDLDRGFRAALHHKCRYVEQKGRALSPRAARAMMEYPETPAAARA